MKSFTHQLLLVICLIFISSIKADDFNLKKEPLCNQVYAVATSALAAKSQGMKKQTMLAALPKRSALEKKEKTSKVLLGLWMHDILDEVFYSYELEKFSYSAYRAEICYRSNRGLDVPLSLKEAYKDLEICAKLNESDRIKCGMRAAGTNPENKS